QPVEKLSGLRSAKDISLVLKQQWRPGLFALGLVIMFFIYWLFYFLEVTKLRNISGETEWFQNWFACLINQAAQIQKSGSIEVEDIMGHTAQRTCSSISLPHVPTFGWIILSEI